MAKVLFDDKVKFRISDLPEVNKLTSENVNEIKESINSLYDIVEEIEEVDATKEDSANKQNSLAVDGTGVKFPTVDAVNTGLTAKESTSNKDATGGYVGLTLFKINFKNVLNTFTSFFTNSNTAARTYTFQDRNGTIADDTDLALKALTTLVGSPCEIEFAVSDEFTPLTTGNGKVTIFAPYNFTLTSLFAGVSVLGTTSGTTTMQVQKNGSDALSTAMTIEYGEYNSLTATTQPVISTASFTKGDRISVDIDAVSGGATEAGLKVVLIGTRS